MAAIRNATVTERAVVKLGRALKLGRKIQNPRRDPTRTVHDRRLETLRHRRVRLKRAASRGFEANKRSKEGTLKVGRDFRRHGKRERASPLFSQRVFLAFRRKRDGFFAQNGKYFTQKFGKAVEKCFR